MKRGIMFLFALGCLPAPGAIVDRTAIVVGKRVVKDSDIQRDLRITSFLNGQQPDFGVASRKSAAARLIDQELIREQIRSGRYPVALETEADQLLAQTKKDRFASEAQYHRELMQLSISENDLKDALLSKAHPDAKSAGDLRQEVEQLIAGERINKLLDEWLGQSRKEIRIDYLEKSLQ